MPYRRTYRRRRLPRRRRRYTRYRRTYGKAVNPNRFRLLRGTGIPPVLTTTLCLMWKDTLSSMGTLYETVFLGNGLQNPLLADSPRQPQCFDQLTALYHKYYVSGCRLVVKANLKQGINATAAQSVMLDVHATRNVGSNSDILTAIERPRAKYRMLTVGTTSYRLVNFAKTRGILGKWNSAQTSDWNENPTDLWYWHVLIDTVSGSNEPWQVDISYEFYYRTTFYERRSLFASTLNNDTNPPGGT